MNKNKLIASVMAGAVAGTAYGNPGQADRMPNMVLIFIDDTGWGTFAPNIADFSESDMNQDFIRTYNPDYTYQEAVEAAKCAMPNLTSYCNEGIRFTNAYVTANVSSPSRAGLLTSSYQQRYGLYINQEAEKGIPEDIKLMPEVLKENGYVNGIFGNGITDGVLTKSILVLKAIIHWTGGSTDSSDSIMPGLIIMTLPCCSRTKNM